MKQQYETEDYNDDHEWKETEVEAAEEAAGDIEPEAESEQKPTVRIATRAASGDDFSDVKEYPENPFSYLETSQVEVQLSSGDVQYEVTDFVLPGRDGFDVSIARRYHSGHANLVDMNPYFKNGYQLKTGSTDNEYLKKRYGLGYGWSFVLPSIETVPYLYYQYSGTDYVDIKTGYDYVLHLEDGRALKLYFKMRKFHGYSLKDVSVDWSSSSKTIPHPYAAGTVQKYHVVITYKNGNKDYFQNFGWDGFDTSKKMNLVLVARQDKFGNVIYYDLKQGGGMTIIDSWGREIQLVKTDHTLTWNLPAANTGEVCRISYQMESGADDEGQSGGLYQPWNPGTTDDSELLRLTAVTNQVGYVTRYSYYDPHDKKGTMIYGQSDSEGSTRKYMLLRDITYPDGALTHLEYEQKITIKNDNGGRVDHYAVTSKKDMVAGTEYNKAEYCYYLSSSNTYISKAKVTTHQDITEIYQFRYDGKMTSKEVLHQNLRIAGSKYTYDTSTKLMLSAIDKTFEPHDPSEAEESGDPEQWGGAIIIKPGTDTDDTTDNTGINKLEKRTYWEYDTGSMGNCIRMAEEYPDDSGLNQETKMKYSTYSMVTETTKTKGTDIIQEINELDSSLGNRVIRCKKIIENLVVKEKTVYEYQDSQNPYCVTSKKKYITGSGQDLDQSQDYAGLSYTYDSSSYTHQCTSSSMTGIQDADGNGCNPIREAYAYDPWGRMISKTDARGQVSTFCYDAIGRIAETKLPAVNGQSNTSSITYYDNDRYIIETDAKDQKRCVHYTPFGQVSQVCLPAADQPTAGDVVLKSYSYNKWGELVTVTGYDGTGISAGQIRRTEQFTYDTFGRVLSRTIPQTGYEEQYQYVDVFADPADGKNYHYERKLVKGDQYSPDIVMESYKDLKGQTRKEYLAGNRIATYEYDNIGNNVRIVDALNKTQRYEYDYANRVVKVILMDANQERMTRVEYDALGNQRYSWDEAGTKTEFQYDKAGRLIQTIAPFDDRTQRIKNYYDGTGNIIVEKKAQTDGWQENRYEYDAVGHLTNTYQYLSQTDWIRTRYEYDVLGNMVLMRTGDTPSGDGNQVTRYTYDRFGNVLTITDVRSCKETYQYDKTGRLQGKTDRNGNQTTYQYDALDRPVKESASSQTADGLVVSEREYAYCKNGSKVQETSRETVDGSQAVYLESRFYYNEKGQLNRQEDPGNAVKEYTYDLIGNRQSFKLFLNGQAAPEISLYYVYDDLYRLKQVRRDSAAGVLLAEYEYDEKGNRKRLYYPQNGMETRYGYNAGNRVITLENRRNGAVIASWVYQYDVDGNLLAKTNQAVTPELAISYQYDRLGRLAQEDYPGWKKTYYSYDAYSNRIKMMVEGKTSEEAVSVTSYEYGANNRLEREIRKQGKVTETYQYCYDNNGNETFRIWEKTAPRPEYRGSVQLSGSWKQEEPTVYEWRHYNGFNQLIRINQDEKEIGYRYRGDGLRHSCEVRKLTESKSEVTVCYWDGGNIVAEKIDADSIKRYLRGMNLIAGEIEGVVYYYVLNEHGDVDQLWKESGTCKATYEYDAFGVEKSPKEKDENPFRYCGEYYDLSSETYYLRARDYRSSTGRFTIEDPIRDGLNWYAYANNNPTMFIDPRGLDAIIMVNSNGGEWGNTGIRFGHMGILLKNDNEQWYYFSCGDNYVTMVEIYNHEELSDLETFSKAHYGAYPEVGPYTDSVYIKGDFTASINSFIDYNGKNMETGNVNSYDWWENNCQTVVMEGFEQGSIADGTNVKDFRFEYIKRGYYSSVPKEQIGYLQDSFFNNAFTYEEYSSQLNDQLWEFKHSSHFWKRSKFKAGLVERLI
ncbi:MAG: RHS repeat-associated core domain-containing protein [Lachnospiraceae bacterium]